MDSYIEEIDDGVLKSVQTDTIKKSDLYSLAMRRYRAGVLLLSEGIGKFCFVLSV